MTPVRGKAAGAPDVQAASIEPMPLQDGSLIMARSSLCHVAERRNEAKSIAMRLVWWVARQRYPETAF
jgi:hypothetical protein